VVDGAAAEPTPGGVEARVCSWGKGPRCCSTATGASAIDAVENAALSLDPAGLDRLGVDWVLGDTALPDRLPLAERAYRAWRVGGRLLTAGEVLLEPPDVAWGPPPGATTEVEVRSAIEDQAGTPTALTGAWPAGPPVVTRELVEDRARAAAGWLAGTIDEDGHFRYEQHPGQPPTPDYNWLRHAGATAELYRAARLLRSNGWAHAARPALQLLVDQLLHRADGTAVLVDNGKVKLGGGGLTLLALGRHHQWSGDDGYLPIARGVGRGLIAAQGDDGAFRAFETPSGEALAGTSLYYPGEAILGLVTLAEWDPDGPWLDAAMRGADHLHGARTAVATEELPADHWLLVALDRLHAVTGDPRFEDQQVRLAVAIQQTPLVVPVTSAQDRELPAGWGSPPTTGATATRAEGLMARLATCSRSGTPCPEALGPALTATGFLLTHQLTRDNAWFLPDDGLTGAFPKAPHDLTCRIDTTQHALSVLLSAIDVVAP